ncbi:hypothetical protein ACWKT3_12125 [Streptomyces violaceus]|uniref:Uncharacterized protein n=3 Tax=Streptomyces TaxID=1883 RepID=A0A7W4ZQF4_9ACTN|nr:MULTISPECIES: hypothetical protein [Streptomyces]MBB3076720.1 hypothetical protein [Streptomyces violarus]MCT9145502.1 hypothetical protein [Streptomyces violarus]WND21344.1 hypothetical protein RI060_30155 [Streptomyces janthinus]WNF62066.1 hypothetical protein RJD14_05455 [Streptomyces sp. CGMCC 4.1456]WRU01609.1 hypothetical protein VJ737_29775 [Streptomyces sp. CGMCC 4.1772]
MSDASTNQLHAADVQETSTGHGRHRGEVSTHDGETAPRGRHRKPAAESEQTETAA